MKNAWIGIIGGAFLGIACSAEPEGVKNPPAEESVTPVPTSITPQQRRNPLCQWCPPTYACNADGFCWNPGNHDPGGNN